MRLARTLGKLRSAGVRGAIRLATHRVFFGRLFGLFEKFALHVLPVHYYSPIPDTRRLRRNFHRWYRIGSFGGIDFGLATQGRLLDQLSARADDLSTLPPYGRVLAKNFGEGYDEVDAHLLHLMIRHLKPRQVIEVGSGVSTVYTASALARNRREHAIASRLVCIEPYPRRPLRDLERAGGMELIAKEVQDVGLEAFQALNQNDILFVDSSHVVKIDSDVNYLYLDVLPSLSPGVIVHVHDISFPYPTPDPERWIFRKHQFWTEAALLQAFLAYNSAFEILLCSSYLHHKAPELLKQAVKTYDPGTHAPSSIWLRKIR